VPPRPTDPRLLAAGCCVLLGSGLSGFRQQDTASLLKTPAPAVQIQPSTVPELEGMACYSCHAEVSKEWASTAHGLAWVDAAYQRELASKKRPELCHGCHVPEPLFLGDLGGRPETRAERREHGVDCESCHKDESGAMLGPHGTRVDAHPSKLSPHMSAPGSNALCISCHGTNIGPVIGIAKDFVSAGFEARGLSCVGCHMAPVERAWAQDAAPHLGRSHALQTPRDPAFLRLAFGLEWVNDGKGRRVVIKNQAGHRVPGLIGRQIKLQAELLDASGAVVEQVETTIDERTYLPVEGTREIPFKKAGTSVRLRGLHSEPRSSGAVTFLDEQLPAS